MLADVRYELQVLLTSSDAILANLTPALVAEANMLRERFAHRYHNRTLFGMYPRNRRGESSRRVEGISSGLDRTGGSISSRRSLGARLIEADGAPLVDTDALHAMIRLLRVVQVSHPFGMFLFRFLILLSFFNGFHFSAFVQRSTAEATFKFVRT